VNHVIDTDKGFARILATIISNAKESYVTIGIHEEQGSQSHGELTVAQIATVHEYGCPERNIPQRSFIRDTHDLNLRMNRQWITQVQVRVLKGELIQHQALTLMGEVGAKQMTSRINLGIPPGLKPATIKRKKSSKPLIDTGQLKGSIGFKVHP
jgi:hypothetical protein